MNIEKLMKSFEAFINHDTDTATRMYREYFIESAQAINAEHEEELEEAFGGDPESDLVDEVVAEGFGDDEGGDDFGSEDQGGDDFGGDDFGGEFGGEAEGEPVEVPADEWQQIQDQFDELEALFAELGDGEAGSDDLSFDEEGGEDEISFGDDDHLEESISMKNVADPGMKSETEADNVKPVLAKQAKSPVAGVSATAGYAGDGTVKGSNTKRDNPDSEKPQVEDRNNVMPSGKKMMKPAPKGAASSEKDADSNAKKSLIKDMRK